MNVVSAPNSMRAPPRDWHDMVGGTADEACFLWYGLKDSTRRTYDAAVLGYVDYARRHGCTRPFFPAPVNIVSGWIAEEATCLGLSGPLFVKTLHRRLTALSSWHTDLGLESRVFDPRVKRMVDGAQRMFGVQSKPRLLPITRPVLHLLLAAMEANPASFGGERACLALRTAFALAFACFLRMNEVTYDKFDLRFHLRRDSLSTDANGTWFITLPISKKDRFGQGTTIPIPSGDPLVCPVRLLERWWATSPFRGGQDPLFVLPGRCFTRKTLTKALDDGLRLIKYSAKEYSGHSFRRGAATWANSIGFSAAEIQALGRWEGSSFRNYLDPVVNPACRRLLTVSEAESSLPANGVLALSQVWRG